ncbi:MAG TPA: hypothetical protein P5136_00245 [Methanofastidiosum sp.]|nr:hypothetical protein [Methanofastidiosum sp.]
MNEQETSSTGVIPYRSFVPAEPIVENTDYFGKYVKKSRACSICIRQDHMEINLMRARDHMKLSDIATNKTVSMDMLNLHFNNHFIISDNIQKILNILENSSKESNELVNAILEGNADLYAGAQGVLEAKGQRLHMVQQRIKELSDYQESRVLEDSEMIEFIKLNQVAEDIENSILKTYQIIDKKLFPMSREELSNAILSYKYGILKKMLDDIQIVFLEFEKNDYYAPLIKNLRISLSERFNLLEDSILKSGGVIQKSNEE